MPSNINIQLAEFQQFVQFAETAIASGKQKAIARVDGFKVKGDCAMRMSMNLTPSENG